MFSLSVTLQNSAVSAATRGPCDPSAYSSRPKCSQLSKTVTVTVTRFGVTACAVGTTAGLLASLLSEIVVAAVAVV
jgi:hypothetical protein